jgi:N-acetyl sugar amidotransferase
MQKEFFRCRKCPLPSTKPDLHFDKNGVCFACLFREHEKTIDWEAREQEFYEMMEAVRPKDHSNYDCIIGVSGGKDSTYQLYLIKEIAGLNPLLVSFEPSYPTEIGKRNLSSMVESFNVDMIQLRKSPTYRRLARIGFDVVGDHEWPNHVGIFCWPMQMALKLKIPYTFYGETRGIIGLGRWETLIDQKKVTRSDVEQYVGMNGYRISDMLDLDPTLKRENILPYIYPSAEEIEGFPITAFTLGYFFHWDYYRNVKIIKNYGWRALDTNQEGTFVNYEDLDCGFMPFHQYFKFIKYGYGRGTDHAAHEVRMGRLTMAQAKELICEYDGKLPRRYYDEFLEFLEIDEHGFLKNVDKFANPFLFKHDGKEKFIRSWDDNLIPEAIWYDSFNV